MTRLPRRRVPIGLVVGAAGVLVVAAWLGLQAWSEARRAPAADAPVVEFAVDGLDCPVWCSVQLSEAIDALDGAVVEGLDRQAGTVRVRHDPARQGVESLRAVVEERGFPVREVRDGGGRQ